MDSFSKRIKPDQDEIIFEDAPHKLRIGLINLIADYIKKRYFYGYEQLYELITDCFMIEKESGINYEQNVKYLIKNKLDWNEIYDLIEFLYTKLIYREYDNFLGYYEEVPEKTKELRYDYTVKINDLLSKCNIGWRLKKGRLERFTSDLLDKEVIQKTRIFLKQKIFEGPNIQFNKALELLSNRPNPDVNNCIKEAVGALEGTVRILLRDEKITLGKAIDKLVAERKIKKPLDKVFHALYGIASNSPGIRHGATRKSDLSISEATFLVFVSASCINFLCELFGYKPIQVSDETEEDIPF